MTTRPTPRPILSHLWPSTLASQLIILLLAAIVGAIVLIVLAALKFFLNSLQTHDYFNVIPFSTDARPFFPQPVQASADNIAKALKQSAAILRHHLDVFDQISEEQIEFESHSKEVSEEQNRLKNLLSMSVNEIELSVRAANCLNNANITTVGELATKSEPEMLKYRNFGKKSLNEIKAKLEQLGLSLGMKFENRLLDPAAN